MNRTIFQRNTTTHKLIGQQQRPQPEDEKMCAPTDVSMMTEDETIIISKNNKKQLPDVFLSCDDPNLEFAQNLKKQVESRCNLLVGLENDDAWEDEENDKGECSELVDHMHQAKQMVVIATEHSNITAWIMDYNQKTNVDRVQALEQRLGCRFERCCKPPTVDFRTSEKEGLNEFLQLLRMNTGYRRYRKPSSSPLVNSIANAIFY